MASAAWWILLVILILAVAGGLTWWFYFREKPTEGAPSTPRNLKSRLEAFDVQLVPDEPPISLGTLSARVSWKAPTNTGSGGEYHYQLQVTDSKGRSIVDEKLPSIQTTTILHDALVPGETYLFSLKACNAVGCSSAAKTSLKIPDVPTVTSTFFSPASLAVTNGPSEFKFTFDQSINVVTQNGVIQVLDQDGKKLGTVPSTDDCTPSMGKAFSCKFPPIPSGLYQVGHQLVPTDYILAEIWGMLTVVGKPVAITGTSPSAPQDFTASLQES